MTRIQETRWKNAVRWAEKVNELLGRGYLMFVVDGDTEIEKRIKNPMVIDDMRIYDVDGRSRTVWFEADPECDHGLHEGIEAWNWRHQIRAYEPVAVPVKW